MTREEVADFMGGISTRTVDNLRARGLLTPVMVGSRCMYEREEVQRYIKEHREQPHRIDVTQLRQQFAVIHGRARGRRFLLGHLHDNRSGIEISSEAISALNQLAKAGGYSGPLLGDAAELEAIDAMRYGEALEAGLAVARMAKAGRTLRFHGDR